MAYAYPEESDYRCSSSSEDASSSTTNTYDQERINMGLPKIGKKKRRRSDSELALGRSGSQYESGLESLDDEGRVMDDTLSSIEDLPLDDDEPQGAMAFPNNGPRARGRENARARGQGGGQVGRPGQKRGAAGNHQQKAPSYHRGAGSKFRRGRRNLKGPAGNATLRGEEPACKIEPVGCGYGGGCYSGEGVQYSGRRKSSSSSLGDTHHIVRIPRKVSKKKHSHSPWAGLEDCPLCSKEE